MAIQTTYDANLPVGKRGQVAREDNKVVESFAVDESNGFDEGFFVAYGTDPETQVSALPALPSEDLDSIRLAATAIAQATVSLSGADFDGSGDSENISPARYVRLTTNNDTDWNVGTLGVRYINATGEEVVDEFAMTDDGNESFDTLQAVRTLIEVTFAAGAGTGRTMTIGQLAEFDNISGADIAGFALYDAAHLPGASVTYQDEDSCPVMRKGFVWATAEDTHTKGASVYVRFTISGAEVKGAVRTDSDSGDALLLSGARFHTAGSAGLCILELDL